MYYKNVHRLLLHEVNGKYPKQKNIPIKMIFLCSSFETDIENKLFSVVALSSVKIINVYQVML